MYSFTECGMIVRFNGKEIKTESTGSGEARRYCLYFDDGLPNGSYKIKAEFQHKKTASETATVAEEFTFAVQQQAWVIPYIDINSNTTLLYGENLEFVVYNIDNWKQTKITIDSGKDIEVQPVDTNSSRLKYSIDMSKYEAGQHKVSIKMYYAGRDGDELIEEETITFNLLSETESYYNFSVPKDVENASPKFFVYKNSGSKVDVTFEPTSGGQRFLKTLDIINNKADYSLVVSYDSGLIVKSLENDDGLIEKNGCNTLTTIKSDKDEIKYAAITRLPGISSSVTIPVSLKNPLSLSQGKYELTIHGTVDGVSFYQTLDIDVTTQDQVIDLSKFALIYYLDTTKSGSSANKYNVSLYIRDDDGWDSYFLSKIVDNESNTLKCYSSSELILSNVEESNQVYMLVYSDTEVHFIKIKDTAKSVMPMLVGLESDSKTITLDKSTLNKVNLLNNNKDLSVNNVHINWNELSLSLYGDTIYIPDGEYKLQVTLTDGVQTFLSNSTATINKDCNVTVGEDIKATYSDVIVEWSKPFDSTATVNCYNMLENWRSIMKITSGNTIKALNGLCSFNIGLSYKDIPIIFTRELTVDENKGNITIGNELTGNFSSSFADEYQTEDSIQFSIRDVKDSNGNSLSTYYFDSSLSGQVIYKDITNQEKIFTVPVSTNSLYNIAANLPNEPGEYSVSVILTLNAPKEELMYSVTVNDSYAQVSGAGKYAAGEIVSISAGKRDNYDFLGWTSSDVTFNDISSETTTFIMPAMDVSVTAQWKYYPSQSPSGSVSISGGGIATVFTPAPSPTVIVTPSPSPVVTVIPSATPVTVVTAKPVSTIVPVPSSSPSPDNDDNNYNTDKVYKISDVVTVALSKKSFIYNGKEKKPFVTVLNNSVELTENTDYTVLYYNNTKVGTATVTITGIGNYSGSINKAFKIVPKGTPIKGKLTAKHKGFIVKWKKQPKSITGYQVQYSTNKKFKGKTTVIKTVKKKFITKLKAGKLKAKKKYYVRVRTYKTIKGKKYYSGWSTAKTVITKK